jgi:hypothetical protein
MTGDKPPRLHLIQGGKDIANVGSHRDIVDNRTQQQNIIDRAFLDFENKISKEIGLDPQVLQNYLMKEVNLGDWVHDDAFFDKLFTKATLAGGRYMFAKDSDIVDDFENRGICPYQLIGEADFFDADLRMRESFLHAKASYVNIVGIGAKNIKGEHQKHFLKGVKKQIFEIVIKKFAKQFMMLLFLELEKDYSHNNPIFDKIEQDFSTEDLDDIHRIREYRALHFSDDDSNIPQEYRDTWVKQFMEERSKTYQKNGMSVEMAMARAVKDVKKIKEDKVARARQDVLQRRKLFDTIQSSPFSIPELMKRVLYSKELVNEIV